MKGLIMNILVGIHTQNIGEEVNSLKASELHAELNQKRTSKNSFIENFDYIKQEVKTSGRPFTEYYITLDMAKHLCMMENNEVGMKNGTFN